MVRGIIGRAAAAGAATAGLALLASPALAGAIVWNPNASNNGTVTLAATPGPFSSPGGSGGVYNDISVASASGSTTYSGDMVVDITSFNTLNSAASGVSSTWQLFAVFSVSGTGSWSPHAGGSTFTISSMSANYDLFGVQGGSSVSFSDPTTASDTNLTDFASFGISGLTASNCDTTGATGTGDKCLLLGTGVGQLGDSLSIIDTSSDLESFGLGTTFTPESWALGLGASGGIFDQSDPLTIDLTVDSGHGNTPNVVPVGGSSTPAFESLSCNPQGVCNPGSDPVTWTGDPVPEPATLSLFGAALVGLALRRRRARA